MPVIKRYPNRKLYNTEAKQYITLDGIAVLIRQREEVHVMDNATGEDLTALTLTQIILEEEKKGGGLLPRRVLTDLIQTGGDALNNLRRTLASSLDFSRQVDEEIGRRIDDLVALGELADEEGLRLRDKLVNPSRYPVTQPVPDDKQLERALAERGVPTRDDLQRLSGQLEALAAKLEQIEPTRPA